MLITDMKKDHDNFILFTLIALLFVLAISSNFYNFLLAKNYNYEIKINCDPTNTTCDSDSCTEEGVCGEEIEYYKYYYIEANQYKICQNSNCEGVCAEPATICKER